jgi:hypothetical protein
MAHLESYERCSPGHSGFSACLAAFSHLQLALTLRDSSGFAPPANCGAIEDTGLDVSWDAATLVHEMTCARRRPIAAVHRPRIVAAEKLASKES